MLERYFVDTWFFIALTDRHDSQHSQARNLARHLLHARLTTHDAVFFEVLAYFSEDGAAAREQAVATVRDAIASMQVVSPNRALFLRAVDRYATRSEKEYSLTDCMSMVVMEDCDIRHVLTNDHHFAQAGFVDVSQ